MLLILKKLNKVSLIKLLVNEKKGGTGGVGVERVKIVAT